ncbi:N-6 DNA methylase [Bacillus sp. FJAT-29953]|nr:N-6 DNA methylase [Bacillus sp. FJAT-29953]
MKDYSKFYTPENLSNFLVKQSGRIEPSSIVDICAGSWNLLNAAKKKWPRAKIKGVDIDNRSVYSEINDGRIFAYGQFAKGVQFDLVLANPPFQYEKIDKEVLNKIKEVTNSYPFTGLVTSRLESTMLIFNSLLVKEGGILAAIVPDSIINAESQHPLRKFLSQKFWVKKIIKLPSNVFKPYDINTSIIILKKTCIRKPTKVYYAENDKGKFVNKFIGDLSYRQIIKGLWHISTQNRQPSPINFNIIRNNILSSFLSETGLPVIHNSSISLDNKINKRKIKKLNEIPNKVSYTKSGDIVISRIGRQAGNFSLITQEEANMLTTDCVLIVRPARLSDSKKLLEIFQNYNIRQLKKGVATGYLTKKDIEDFIFFANS